MKYGSQGTTFIIILLFMAKIVPNQGAPVAYVPLSLQVPDYYRQLQEQQAAYVDYKTWWLSRGESQSSFEKEDVTPEGPTVTRHQYDPETLQDDLLSAISSPLTPQPNVPAYNCVPIPPIKTSESHPLKSVARTCFMEWITNKYSP